MLWCRETLGIPERKASALQVCHQSIQVHTVMNAIVLDKVSFVTNMLSPGQAKGDDHNHIAFES